MAKVLCDLAHGGGSVLLCGWRLLAPKLGGGGGAVRFFVASVHLFRARVIAPALARPLGLGLWPLVRAPSSRIYLP